LSALEQLREVVEHRHQYAQDWQRRTGGRVVGYLCSYVPEEVLYAADVLPVRVLGEHQLQDLTDPHIFGMFCAYCRDVLGQGLLGNYSYLNGITLAHVCAHISQTYDSWRRHIPVEFARLLWMPSQVQSQAALPFFLAEVASFQQSVEQWLDRPVSEAALRRAIAVYDDNRRLLRTLYEYRKEQRPRISGREAMEVVIASTVMDKTEHSRLLEQLLSDPGRPQDGVRLMVVGSENNDAELLGFIESRGAVVVIEDNCLGNRYFWNGTPPDGDPRAAIARRYLDKLPCPLLDVDSRRRGQHLLELAREYRVAGVVFLRQKFCDPHGWEQPVLQTLFEDTGLPCLTLELDFTVPAGQYRTRIEAFLELYL